MRMHQPLRQSHFISRSVALALFAGASTLALHAQQTAAPEAAGSSTPAGTLFARNTTPNFDLAAAAGVNYSSSSSSSAVDAERLNLASDALQPPPRRRYGRPRYNDSSHNPDGSNKYAFVVGGGFTAPVGNTYHYLNTNYAFQVGAGRNFNKNFALMVQFDYDRFGFNGRTLGNQQNLYNFYCSTAQANAGLCTQFTSLDGNSHVWSFTLDPTYSLHQGDSVGAYIVGGVGFFHKTANFTVPTTGTAYDPYYGYYQYAANATVDKYTANAPGFDGGFGLTYKPSRFAGERFYAEGRYVFIPNSQRAGVTVNSSATTLNTYAGNNYYPANSNRTTYTVYKAGIRF